MSEKTFLQELQAIKVKLELLYDNYEDESYWNIPEDINEVIGDVKTMIDKCLEIQLAMMKQGKMLDAKGR